MISPLVVELARARTAELQRTAAPRVSPVGAARPPRAAHRIAWPSRTRRRAGWWLVTVGLRLAAGSPSGLR
ncbi:MAG: hypothetical protein ACTHK4_01485 [Mycobacteriales bacterium]